MYTPATIKKKENLIFFGCNSRQAKIVRIRSLQKRFRNLDFQAPRLVMEVTHTKQIGLKIELQISKF